MTSVLSLSESRSEELTGLPAAVVVSSLTTEMVVVDQAGEAARVAEVDLGAAVVVTLLISTDYLHTLQNTQKYR